MFKLDKLFSSSMYFIERFPYPKFGQLFTMSNNIFKYFKGMMPYQTPQQSKFDFGTKNITFHFEPFNQPKSLLV